MTSSMVLLGDDGFLAHTLTQRRNLNVVNSADGARRAYASRQSGCVWIAMNQRALEPLRGLVGTLSGQGRLLVLEPMEPNRRSLLGVLFRVVLSAGSNVKLLARTDLAEVLMAPNCEDLFIGGFVDQGDDAVVLYRGDLTPLVVPLTWFTERAATVHADPQDFEVTDCGQTVRLGDFEAAHDAILYAFDAEYRRRLKRSRIQDDQTFGASLRRLRLAKGLRRSDFPEVNEKEVARIERGEVKRPHSKTVALLARQLGVEPGDIATY